MKPEAVILAGGKSQRMGTDKALLTIAGETLLARTVRLLHQADYEKISVIGREPVPELESKTVHFVADGHPGEGPLAALATALAQASQTVLVLPCDLPLLTVDAISWLKAQEVGEYGIVPTTPEGKYQPLFALYQPNILPIIQTMLKHGERSFKSLLSSNLLTVASIPESLAHQLESANGMTIWIRLTKSNPIE